MNSARISHWLSIIANFSVLVGIYFLVLEIRAGEESNTIGIQQAYTANSIQILTLTASDEFSSILEKGATGEELTALEKRKLNVLINMHLAQFNFLRRLYERGIATENEAIDGAFVLRNLASNPAVRDLILQRSDELQQLALEEGGAERFIRELNSAN